MKNLRRTFDGPVLAFKIFFAALDTVLLVNKLVTGEFNSFSVIS